MMIDHSQKAKPQQNWVSVLLTMVKELKLNEQPQMAELVRKVVLKNDQRLAEKLVLRLKQLHVEHQLNPNPFLSRENNLESDIVLGYTPDEKPLGISLMDLTRHLFASGQSGSGKSVFLESLIFQLKERGIPLIHFDRKGDLVYAVKHGIDSIHWEQVRKNFLCPPDNSASALEWRNDHVKAFSELMQFYQRGMSIYLQGVHALFNRFKIYENWHNWNWQEMSFPTMKDLLLVFKDGAFTKNIKGQGKESLLSIIDKLESICIELDPIISCQRGFDIARIYREKKCVSYMLDGVAVEYQNFLIVSELLAFYHYFKVHGPRNQLNVVFVFDEAKGLFGKQNQNAFIIKDIISKVREFGIAIICADQVPSEISQFLFSNIGTLVFFRHSDGNDLRRLQFSSGANPDQILSTYALQPGEAIVRTQRLKDLHRIKTRFEPVDKFIPKEEADRLMAPRLTELQSDVIPMREAETEPTEASDSRDFVDENTVQSSPNIGALSEEERTLLEALARDFERPSSHVFKELGWVESKGFKIKKRLLAKKYISQVSTNLGKDGKKAAFLIPNPIVFEELGIKLGAGRGKALHRHFQNGLAEQAKKLGWKARIEDCAENGEGPDVGLEKDSKRVAVEICVTSKPSQEAQNIAKNFALGFDAIILCFVNTKVLEKTKEIVGSRYEQKELERVGLCLINQFAEILRKF